MAEIDKTKEIKAAIEELLKSEEIDYSRFTTLSNELLKQDREHVRFSVDAGIINRLGKELVGRAETAISELISVRTKAKRTTTSSSRRKNEEDIRKS